MWYVLQTHIGQEEDAVKRCMEYISGDVLKDCFILKYERKMKYQGEWMIKELPMFPGYLFLDLKVKDKSDEKDINTGEEKRIYGNLKKVVNIIPEIYKIMKLNEILYYLEEGKIKWLLELVGEKHVISASEGVIENGILKISNGPLVGMERYIKKIDRHKRIAAIEIPFLCEEKKSLRVGLEITRKS